jgi:hypothetical protein
MTGKTRNESPMLALPVLGMNDPAIRMKSERLTKPRNT